MAEKTGSTKGTGNGAAQTVAVPPPGGTPPKSPPGVSAAAPKPPPPPNRGGRPRKDGLPPGSPQAEAADKKRERERKQLEREATAKVVLPPPLPSAVAPNPGPSPTSPGVPAPATVGPDVPPVPWQPEILSGLIDELIEAAEQSRVEDYLKKCNEAGLMPKLVKEIENDARFPRTAKALLKTSLPRLSAKWLNKTGISAEYQDEISCLSAVILIVKHNSSVDARFDEILLELKKQKTPPPTPKPEALAAPAPPVAPAPVAPLKIPAAETTIEVKL